MNKNTKRKVLERRRQCIANNGKPPQYVRRLSSKPKVARHAENKQI